MAVDKLVDSSQLDTDLTSVANAIRTKGGTSATLSFPSEFISAIEAISTGGVTITDTIDSNGGTIREIDTFGETLMLQTKSNIVPTTSSQTIVPDIGYVGLSSVQVVGDANLVPENIKKDVTLFNVTGTCEVGGSDPTEFIETTFNWNATFSNSKASRIGVGKFAFQSVLTAVSFPSCTYIDKYAFYACTSLRTVSIPLCTSINYFAFYSCTSLTTVSFPSCTKIGFNAFDRCIKLNELSFPVCTSIESYAFQSCWSLFDVSFPSCISIGEGAFTSCNSLSKIYFPLCEKIGPYAFRYCSKLTTASFSLCLSIGGYAFNGCKSLTEISFPVCSFVECNAFQSCSILTTASFPSCTIVGSSAFEGCFTLTSLYLLGSSVATLSSTNAFMSTPIGGYVIENNNIYGSIFVPSSLLTEYKSATNWTYLSSRIVGV